MMHKGVRLFVQRSANALYYRMLMSITDDYSGLLGQTLTFGNWIDVFRLHGHSEFRLVEPVVFSGEKSEEQDRFHADVPTALHICTVRVKPKAGQQLSCLCGHDCEHNIWHLI